MSKRHQFMSSQRKQKKVTCQSDGRRRKSTETGACQSKVFVTKKLRLS